MHSENRFLDTFRGHNIRPMKLDKTLLLVFKILLYFFKSKNATPLIKGSLLRRQLKWQKT